METDPPDLNDIAALERHIAELRARQGAGKHRDVATQMPDVGADQNKKRGVSSFVEHTNVVRSYFEEGNPRLSKAQIAQQIAQIAKNVSRYLNWLRERTEHIELRGIERSGGAPVVLLPIETAYVPLQARIASSPDVDVPLSKILSSGKRLVITGGPGSGKTTVLLHTTWALATSLATGKKDPASRLGFKGEPIELPLPIFLPIASFARYRRNLPVSAPANVRTLAHFICHHLTSKQGDFDLPSEFFSKILKIGANTILLLDGLDEVADENERAEMRQSVEELVAGRAELQVVVTCRTIVYRAGRTALGAKFEEFAVQPLSMAQHIVPMVRQAYACIHPSDSSVRAARISDLLGGIRTLEAQRRKRLDEHAEPLVNSPLMVRLLLIVHVNDRRLPDERADLFNKAINALLQVDYGREESDIRELAADWKVFRDMAQHVAFHMHQSGDVPGREIEDSLLRKFLSMEPEFEPRIDEFLAHARQRGSVLEEHAGVYRFLHLALQEFLVARYLAEVIGRESRDLLLKFVIDRIGNPWWREPVLLLAGHMAAESARSARIFLSALAEMGGDANARFSAVELASLAALERRDGAETIRLACTQRILDLFADQSGLNKVAPRLRARVGDALARLDDPRFASRCFYLPTDDLVGFVRIPPDPHFRIGTRKAEAQRVAKLIDSEVSEREINDELTPTPEFYVGRYLVTVAQFRAFVFATRFPISDRDALRDPDNRPVRFVTWREAKAYCSWLREVLVSSPIFDGSKIIKLMMEGHWNIDLPSELEWEKAARGLNADQIFPWGDEVDPYQANCKEAEIGSTSTVGCFAASEVGLYDISGNVWQWTRSRYAPYPYRTDDGRESAQTDEHIVVRGGSWRDKASLARCACRDGDLPGYRPDRLGFRLVLRSTTTPLDVAPVPTAT